MKERSRHNRIITSGTLALVLITSAMQGCSPGTDPGPATASVAAFRNVAAETRFVGDEACFECHEEQYRGYQDHGMARSYYPLTDSNRVEDNRDVRVLDPHSELVYTVIEVDGALYQQEHEESPAGPENVLRRRMDFVVGSGNAARTYLTEKNGRLYQLPLTWYTQEEKWDFSPGYRTANHRFSRLVPDRCMACHNSYPKRVPFVDGKFGTVPHGIGCERCHGPGDLHVAERQEVPEPVSQVDDSIVNPRHLTLDRRLDVCQQCHLHTTVSILRENREPFGFRPSQALDGYLALFAQTQGATDNQIDVISHADRMKQSACFAETVRSDNPMECTTCHNPHEAFRSQGPEYFNATCVGCHSAAVLEARLSRSELANEHQTSSDCIDCHMPKVEAEDAPHSSFTDHKIRIVTDDSAVPDESAASEARLEPYFERDRDSDDGAVYAAMADIIYGQQVGQPDMMRSGADALSDLLEGDTTRGEAHYLRGLALHLEGRIEAAIPSLETALRAAPNNPDRLNGLAQAYEGAGRSAVTINRLYRRALAIQPAATDIRVNYGRFLQVQDRFDEAEEQYLLATEEDPWLAVAWYNLGTLKLAAGDQTEAEDSFREALRLDPFYADAIGNLAALRVMGGDEEGAEELFERAVQVAPENRTALGNLGALRLNQGRLGHAIDLLTRAVGSDSLFVDGLSNLALAYFRSEDVQRARQTASRALRLDPSNALARQILIATE